MPSADTDYSSALRLYEVALSEFDTLQTELSERLIAGRPTTKAEMFKEDAARDALVCARRRVWRL
jgi:hypothetical protein